VWTLAEARVALARLIGTSEDWNRLDEFLIDYVVEPSMRSTAMASSLAATLEMVKEGSLELHQHAAFAPIYLRKRIVREAANDSGAAMPGGANQ
jgi:segregation and condensation protein A